MTSESLFPSKSGETGTSQTAIYAPKSHKRKPADYTSHGITDNDIFLLPGSDYQLMGLLTAIAMAVRLFRIYQPSSVVFDEVQ